MRLPSVLVANSLLLMAWGGPAAQAQSALSCRQLLDSLIIGNMIADKLLLDEAEKARLAATLKPKKLREELAADEEVKLAVLQNTRVLSCDLRLQPQQAYVISGEAFSSLGSRVFPQGDLASFRLTEQPRFLFPAEYGTALPVAAANSARFNLTSKRFLSVEASLKAETKAYFDAKTNNYLKRTAAEIRQLSFVSGTFKTYQSDVINGISTNRLVAPADIPFLMNLWDRSGQTRPGDSLLQRMTGLFVYNSYGTESFEEKTLDGSLSKSFNPGIVKIDAAASLQGRYMKQVNSSSNQYKFYLQDRPEFVALPTRDELKAAWRANIADKVQLSPDAIDLDKSNEATLTLKLDNVTRDICQLLTVDKQAIEKMISPRRLLQVQPRLQFTSLPEADATGSATAQLKLSVNPDFNLDPTSEISKTGFTSLPLRVYYSNVVNGDTLWLLNSDEAVRLKFNNFPTVEQVDFKLVRIDTKDSMPIAYHYEGEVSFQLADNQQLQPVAKGNAFFIKLLGADSVANAPSLLYRFRQADPRLTRGNTFQLSLSIPASFINARELYNFFKLEAVVPLKQQGELVSPRRYVEVVLPTTVEAGGNNPQRFLKNLIRQ